MPFCPKCGNKVGEEDSFCFSCGANLEESRIRLQEGEDTSTTQEIHAQEEPEYESSRAIHIDRSMTKQSWITSVGTFLSKTKQILKYLMTMRKRRLYKQWVEAAGLPPEAIPQDELAEGIIPQIDWKQFRLILLYVLMGVSVLIVFTGVILLLLHSC